MSEIEHNEQNLSVVASKEGGNKQPPPLTEYKFQCKNWIMTWNNYPENWKEQVSKLIPMCDNWSFFPEKGESGTPHIQGAFMLKSKKRQGTIYKIIGSVFFLDKMKGSWEQQCYTQKEGGDGLTNRLIEKEEIYIEEPSEDLLQIAVLMENYEFPKGDRKINVIVDYKGNIGKTEFCRWAVNKFDRCIITGGKSGDMKNQIVDFNKKNKCLPKYILFDVPRSNLNFLSYQGIEEVKNMLFYSGKYEGGMICGNKPFICLFLNEYPKIEKMSKDRWNIIVIDPENKPKVSYLDLDSDSDSE